MMKKAKKMMKAIKINLKIQHKMNQYREDSNV